MEKKTIDDINYQEPLFMVGESEEKGGLRLEGAVKPPEVKKPFIELTKKKAVVWFVIVLIACGWMFILGILVGRGTAPVQFDVDKLKKDLVIELKAAVDRENEERKAAEAKASSDQVAQNGNPPLDFYEDLKSTKEAQEKINIGAAPKQETVPSPVLQKEIPAKEVQVKEPKDQKVKEKTETPPPEPKPAKQKEPVPPEKDVKGLIYTVQVASVKDWKSADKLVADLVRKGYPAYSSSGEIPGKGTWYRVRIGEFGDKSEAEGFLSGLGKNNIKGMVVKK
jgi:cell division septation protein DedD